MATPRKGHCDMFQLMGDITFSVYLAAGSLCACCGSLTNGRACFHLVSKIIFTVFCLTWTDPPVLLLTGLPWSSQRTVLDQTPWSCTSDELWRCLLTLLACCHLCCFGGVLVLTSSRQGLLFLAWSFLSGSIILLLELSRYNSCSLSIG